MVRDVLHYDPFQIAQSLLSGKPLSGHSVIRKALRQVEADADAGHWLPRCDIRETDDSFVLYAEMPGVDPSEIDVLVQNDTLTISAERHLEHEKKGADFNLIERVSGSFKRQFTLPDIDPEQISAKGKHGVLEVTIKKKEKLQPKKIVVDTEASG
jgi:HSP20 family protein